MAVFRKQPVCPKCGEKITGRYKKSKLIGDNFIGWNWEEHAKNCKSYQRDNKINEILKQENEFEKKAERSG